MDKHKNVVDKLVYEMGFSITEANMALAESHGDIDQAVQLILSGKFAPPPYSPNNIPHPPSTTYDTSHSKETQQQQHHSFLPSFLKPREKPPAVFDNPSAPSVFDIPSGSVAQSSALRNEIPDFTKDMHNLPPPYEKLEKQTKMKEWENNANDFNVFHFTENNNNSISANNINKYLDKRCPACFNEILSTSENGVKYVGQEIVEQNPNYFHYACFVKKHGPKCAHCCFPLSLPDKDHDLSGKYLKYNGRDYHVECYEKYAGPRCAYCCNVIVEVPSGDYSGNRIVDGHKEFHIECYQKKMYAIWRAKNS